MSIRRGLIIGSGKQYEAAFDTDGPDAVVRVSCSYSAFAAASTTGNVDIPCQPGIFLQDVWAVNRQNFTGGGNASATLSVGVTATPTLYMLATSVFTGASAPIGIANAQKGTAFTAWTTAFINTSSPWSTGTIRIQLITSVNTNLLTAGKVDVFFIPRIASVRS